MNTRTDVRAQAGRAARLAIASSMLLCMSCGSTQTADPSTRLRRKPFGTTPSGEAVELFTLAGKNGFEVEITNYGGIVVAVRAPDKRGAIADVVLGFDDLKGYLGAHPYFGALIGRYANRIAKGEFTLNGVGYKLARNNGENHLHGGVRGFDKVVWQAQAEIKAGGDPTLDLKYMSLNGEEGYPGNLTVQVFYSVTDKNELTIRYVAFSDKDTIVNLTNHSYFNLAGAGQGDILSHEAQILADRYTPVDAGLIPTGELAPVQGTPFDFTQPTKIGLRINGDHPQLKAGKGYDHNFVWNRRAPPTGPAYTPYTYFQGLAARVRDPGSGRTLEVETSEPGVQFYTGNFLDGTITGKGGKTYGHRAGFCLETQHFPDSPNKPQFPTVVLRAGQRHQSITIYRFLAE